MDSSDNLPRTTPSNVASKSAASTNHTPNSSTPSSAITQPSTSAARPYSCRLIRHLLGNSSLSPCHKTTLSPSGRTIEADMPQDSLQSLTADNAFSPTLPDNELSTSRLSVSSEILSTISTTSVSGDMTSSFFGPSLLGNASSEGSLSSFTTSSSLPGAEPNMGTNQVSQNSNCIIKSLISSASSFFPSSNGPCSGPIIRKFYKLTDGCKKPVQSCSSQQQGLSADSQSSMKIKSDAPDTQNLGPTTNNFINQIIHDNVPDHGQQFRILPSASGPCIKSLETATMFSNSKNYRENFVALLDSVIANMFQTESVNSPILREAAKAAEAQRFKTDSPNDTSVPSSSGTSQHCHSHILEDDKTHKSHTRAKTSKASSLDSGVTMMDCAPLTAESVANMTNIAVHELIAGRTECLKKPGSEPEESDRQISNAVYQQLIEFELTNDSILRKFQIEDNLISVETSCAIARFDLNRIETEKLEELEKAFFPFQLCFSSISDEDLWRRIRRSFWSPHSNINLEYQRQSLLAATESAVNMLVVMIQQLPSFMMLPSECQKAQLRSSVMEIMMIRSLLVSPQRLKNQSILKACGKRHRENSIGEEGSSKDPSLGECSKSNEPLSYTQKYYNFIHQPSKFLHTLNECRAKLYDSISKPELEPCNHNPLMKFLYENEHLDESSAEECFLAEVNSECSRDGQAEESGDNIPNDSHLQPAHELAKQYRKSFFKLAKSIDREWHEDKHIFHLLLVILLFRPVKSINDEVKKKIREEHLTYVYLLKRYLESKFRSYCTARSHFIRLFDRLEEVQKMNDHIVQKLLDFDLICAQNLLENLCVC